MLRDASDDITAFARFAVCRWTKFGSTNSLERLNKEIHRRTDVVGLFLNPAALLQLAGAVLVEAHDECRSAHAAACPKAPWTCSPPRTPTRER
jgi:putative transposase